MPEGLFMSQSSPVIALAGNPNVGKSTLFNSLTGLKQHTGNWAGVTVACTSGTFSQGGQEYIVVDLPGIYSLDTRTEEEKLAKDFITSGTADCIAVVCDATCLVRGLYLLKQIEELTAKSEGLLGRLFLCVNLCDEAKKKGIVIDFDILKDTLKIPVIGTQAHKKKSTQALKEALANAICADFNISDTDIFNTDISDVDAFDSAAPDSDVFDSDSSSAAAPDSGASDVVCSSDISGPRDTWNPDSLAEKAVSYTNPNYRCREERLDRILTAPFFGGLLMFLLLLLIFWITIAGANYPSSLLWELLHGFEEPLLAFFRFIHAPLWMTDGLIFGVYRVVSWVVSVMLPPMAIFFPLFTLLEDLGYLPRIAFNLDGAFKKCRTCGKQCLTMAMGFGCNAAGVVGCRIIDSPRERLIAILTNSLVPCNGRFPTLLMLISFFFMGTTAAGAKNAASSALVSLGTALLLTCFILLGVGMTLAASFLLSKTFLKGIPSSFTLELPPYRKPQIRKILVRSLLDRTLFVLGRALAVAAPAGLLIWLSANLAVGDTGLFWMGSSVPADSQSILSLITSFLDPLGHLMGLDGVILTAFLLGFPANEIVVPIILMAYLQTGYLTEFSSTAEMFSIFTANGWTFETILCMAVFSLFHWPCSTTCLTIRKETGSLKWTAAAFLLPSCIGFLLCTCIHLVIASL